MDDKAAVFVMPTPSTNQSGPVAVWITAAGWAAAARRMLGPSWIVTPSGILSPEQARTLATLPSLAPRAPALWKRLLPSMLKVGIKDLLNYRRARRSSDLPAKGPWDDANVLFIWQRHDLFHSAGLRLGRALSRPVVLFVDAPSVWEGRKWEINRPGWGRWLERFGEDPQFRAANLLACVSDEVAEEVCRRGAHERRIVVTPCSVDLSLFQADATGHDVRAELGLEGRFVVGWVGSFRRFHGVELALAAASLLQHEIPELALLLVGDGSERPSIQSKARRLGLRHVAFTGTVPYTRIADHMSAMDVALVLDRGVEQFHYSPLKLMEYMATARPVVAPRVGYVSRFVRDGAEGILVEPGSTTELAAAIRRLYVGPDLRRSLGVAARKKVAREGSWDHQVTKVVVALEHTHQGIPA